MEYKNLQYKKTPSQSNFKFEYKKFRVKSAIKSFRDLEVYRKTNELASEIFIIKISRSYANFKPEFDILRDMAKTIPKLIAESYGDKFSGLNLALGKLEKAAQIISGVITKIDFLIISIDDAEIKDTLNKILRKYQIQRVKVLNLKKAWSRVFGRDSGRE